MPEETEIVKFDPKAIGAEICKCAKEADGDVDTFLFILDIEAPKANFTRDQARQIIRYVTGEKELDILASAPTNVEVLNNHLDKALAQEIGRLTVENERLGKVLEGDPDKAYRVKGFSDELTFDDAKIYIRLNTEALLEIKKQLTDQRKMEAAAGNINVALNVDLGGLISEALDNVKVLEAEIKSDTPIDVEDTDYIIQEKQD